MQVIPDATETDYERDAEADYVYDPNSLGYCSWIRRAVAAEKESATLNAQFDEVWRLAQSLIKALAQRA